MQTKQEFVARLQASNATKLNNAVIDNVAVIERSCYDSIAFKSFEKTYDDRVSKWTNAQFTIDGEVWSVEVYGTVPSFPTRIEIGDKHYTSKTGEAKTKPVCLLS